MRKILSGLLIFGVLSCSHTTTSQRDVQALSGTDNPKEIQMSELRASAHSFYKRGDYLRALPYFELMTQMQESSLKAEDKFVMGYCYLSVGETEKAFSNIQSGIQLSPYSALGYQLLGLAALSKGKIPQAIENYKRGLEFDSHLPKLHFYLGLALEKQNKNKEAEKEFQKAEEEYEKILEKNPLDFGANYELAYMHLILGTEITRVGEYIEKARKGLKDPEPDLLEGAPLYTQFYLPMLQGLEALRKNEPAAARVFFQQAMLSAPLGAKADLAEVALHLAVNEKAENKPELSKDFESLAKSLDPVGVAVQMKTPKEITKQ